MEKRVFLIVLDSCGCGEMPDSADFGDAGSNTLRACTTSSKLNIPMLTKMGIFNIDEVGCGTPVAAPVGAYGPHGGKEPRQGYHHRTLGAGGSYFAPADADLPRWFPGELYQGL